MSLTAHKDTGMTKEQAIATIKAHIEFMNKPMPEYGTEAHDEYRIEAHALSIRVRRAMKEYPSIREDGEEPQVTAQAKKL